MPSKFSTSPGSCTPATWSLYATLATSTTPSGGTKVTGACGSSNGATLTSTPSANLCSAGTASAISGAGPWSWTCAGSNGGTTATCSALKATAAQAVNGACGSSNGASLTSAPTTNLCSVGTASAVSGAGPWSWNCAGSNGGATASCSATNVQRLHRHERRYYFRYERQRSERRPSPGRCRRLCELENCWVECDPA